jgi:hypothetical protein
MNMLNYLDSNPHRGIEWNSDTNPELMEIIVKATGITIKNLPARTETGEYVLVNRCISMVSLYREDFDCLDDVPDDNPLGSGDIGRLFKPNQELSKMDLAYCGLGDDPTEDNPEDIQNKLQAPMITVGNGYVETDEVCIDLDEVLFSSLRNLN